MAKELNVLLMDKVSELNDMEAEAQNILLVKRNSKTEEMEAKANGNE